MEDMKPTEPIVDVTDYPESPSLLRKGKVANVYDKTLCKDNKPLRDFINKCICLDPTIEMERIINIVLLPAYCNADNEYKKSDKFKKVITKAFERLKNDPDKKYNHICGVFETLKVHRKTTTAVSANNSADTDFRKSVNPKKPTNNVIDLDDDDEEIVALANPEVNDTVKTENNDLVNGNTVKIEEKLQTNDKANVNNLAVNTPGVAAVNRLQIDNNALRHNKTPKQKKRVNLITLSTTVSAKPDLECRKRANGNKEHKLSLKKPKLDVIKVDSDDDGEIMAVDNPEVVAADDMVKIENNDVVNGDTIKIENTQQLKIGEELQTNDKTNVNNLAVNTPGVAAVNRSQIDNNAPLRNKTPKKKKRENTTFSNTESAKPNADCRKRDLENKEYDKLSPKKPRLDFIKLDSDDDVSEVVDDKVNDNLIEIQDSQELKIEEMQTSAKKNDKNLLIDSPIAANAENTDNVIEIQDSQELKTDEDVQNDNTKTKTSYTNSVPNETEEDKENLDNLTDSVNKLLVPQLVQVEKKQELDEAEKAQKIKQIEAAIAKCKQKISELELAEVNDDTEVSPYIQCHKLEARIVKLHRDWLDLVEAEPAKGREVRLTVSEGHPEGPIRRLEAFLNEQVDEEGVAPFPDFIDVVRCVKKANREDGLGWSKPQIMSEAKEIFIYCGRALQKRRQYREYKRMRSRVPRDAFDDDPAERDAELRAKLELNKKLASKREKEILKRHCRLQKDLTKTDVQTEDKSRVTSSFFVNRENENSSDDELTPTAGPSNNPMDQPTIENSIEVQNNVENHETCLDNIIVKVKEEPIDIPVNIQYKGDISLVIEISDSESSDDETPDSDEETPSSVL